jgi:aromatic-L-amino-acid/L-tryptophan decarboxylase
LKSDGRHRERARGTVQSSPVKPEPFRDLDWEPKRAREIGERALDLWEQMLERLRELPVSRYQGAERVHEAVGIAVPDDPMPLDELFGYLREVVLERSMYPGHPGFMAYITGAGTVPGVAADLLAAGLNQNLGGWRLSPAASEIELHLTRWLARQFGLPEGSGGLIVSGGAMANFVGLKVARDRKAGWDVRGEGVRAGPQLVIYGSDEVHSVSQRAADMLGLGRAAVRQLPTDDGFRLRLDALRAAVDKDRAVGRHPIAVVASAGTVATGAIDPLEGIADLCVHNGLWFHVDAAYGGPGVLADELRPLYSGIERADSIAFDPHKWLYTPHSGGCVLVRDFEDMPRSFSIHEHASYVFEDKARTGTGLDGNEMGPQFSRGFWALKVWVSLLAHGRKAYARRIAHDVELARYLGERVEERPDFERMAPVTLSICCFRYIPEDLPDDPGREEYLDSLNERLMTEIQMDGRVYPSNAVLGGRFTLRACIVNFRTEAEEMDLLLDVAAELGERLDGEMRPDALRS